MNSLQLGSGRVNKKCSSCHRVPCGSGPASFALLTKQPQAFLHFLGDHGDCNSHSHLFRVFEKERDLQFRIWEVGAILVLAKAPTPWSTKGWGAAVVRLSIPKC